MNGTVLLSLISPVVAVVIAIWGFRRSSRADKLRAFFEVQERYLASEVRNGRRIMHTLIAGRPPGEVSKLDPDKLSAAGYALAVMNSIAIACEAGYVDQSLSPIAWVAHLSRRSPRRVRISIILKRSGDSGHIPLVSAWHHS